MSRLGIDESLTLSPDDINMHGNTNAWNDGASPLDDLQRNLDESSAHETACAINAAREAYTPQIEKLQRSLEDASGEQDMSLDPHFCPCCIVDTALTAPRTDDGTLRLLLRVRTINRSRAPRVSVAK